METYYDTPQVSNTAHKMFIPSVAAFEIYLRNFIQWVPSSFSINLLMFYHEFRSLISYVTHYLFCDR